MQSLLLKSINDELKLDKISSDSLAEILYTIEDSPVTKEIVQLNPLTGNAETIKIKNLSFNLKKLSIDILELGVGIAGAIATP